MSRKGLFVSVKHEFETPEQLLLLKLAPQYFDFKKINYNDIVAEVDELYDIQNPTVRLNESEILLCVLQSIHMILLVNDRMKWDAQCLHFGIRFKNRGAAMQLTFTNATEWNMCGEHDAGRGSRIQRNAEGLLKYMQATFDYSPNLRQLLWTTLATLASGALENHVVLHALMQLSKSLYWVVRDGDTRDTHRRATARSHELCARIADRIDELNGPRRRSEDVLDGMMQRLIV
jgi:hypothetical protein